jgi:hypothetical protein
MAKFRKPLRILFLSLLGLTMIYCVTKYIQNGFKTNIVEVDCGTIVSKSDYDLLNRYDTKTVLFFNIQFKKRGFQVIEVTPVTYFKHEVNDNICFELQKENVVLEQLAVILGCLLVAFSIVGLVLFVIIWLFGEF